MIKNTTQFAILVICFTILGNISQTFAQVNIAPPKSKSLPLRGYKPRSKVIPPVLANIPTTDASKSIAGNKAKSTTPTGFNALSWDALKVISELRKKDPTLKLHFDSEQLPILIEGNNLFEYSSIDISPEQLDQETKKFLDQIAPVLQLKNPSQELVLNKIEIDPLGGMFIRYEQSYKGIPVWGGDLLVHSKEGKIHTINGSYFPTPKIESITPSISTELAILNTENSIKEFSDVTGLNPDEQKILNYSAPIVQAVIFTEAKINNSKLTYHITHRPNFVQRYEYFIDAHSGEVVNYFDNTCYDGPATTKAKLINNQEVLINTYNSGGKFYLIDASRPMFKADKSKMPTDPIGAILTFDNKNQAVGGTFSICEDADNVWDDKTAVTAHHNCAKAYEYYKNVHSRESIDGKGGNIRSFVNVTNSNGTAMDNAFWNGQIMAYGNGNTRFKPLAGSLDIAAHELTHGVIENSANLIYQDQSGAINESMADVFGALVDRDDWKIAEDVAITTSYKSGALRDLSNPNQGLKGISEKGWQPKHFSEFITTKANNGGVHSNSGIVNHAFFKYATAVTKEKAEKVYYRALTVYLSRSSQFIDLRIAIQKAAKDLFGDKGAEYLEVGKAFDAVGIMDGKGNDFQNNLDAVVGSDFIIIGSDKDVIIYDTENDVIIPAYNEGISPSRASVTDDGQHAYFVSKSGNIVHLDLKDISTPVTDIIKPIEGIPWLGVSVSSDNKRLALVSNLQDTSIYVYHQPSKQTQRFKLYTPTYSDDSSKAGSPKEAYNILWNYTGEYVLYDALYNYKLDDGEVYEYFDIGYFRSWDPAGKTFGDGENFSFLPNLPEGVQVNTPFYTKNSPYIIGFDLQDVEDKNIYYSTLAINNEINEVGTLIDSTNTISYGSYNMSDSQMAYNFTSNNGNDIEVGLINLKDKINGDGNPPTILTKLKGYEFPVWFAQGSRVGVESDLSSPKAMKFSANPIPFDDQLKITWIQKENSPITIEIFDLTGRNIQKINLENTPKGEQTFNLSEHIQNLNSGTYVLKLTGNSDFYSVKIVKK